MRVATFNIHHGAPRGRPGNQLVAPVVDHRMLARAVESLDAEIVGLQEVDRRVARSWFADQARAAASLTGHRHIHAAARMITPFGHYGQALLYRGDLLVHQSVALRSMGEPRVALFARLGSSLGEVTVAVTHLQNPRRGRPEEAAGQLEEVLGILRRWPRPQILLGDLNLRSGAVLPRLEDAGFVAADTGPTCPEDVPSARIDWIAARGLRIRAAEVPDLRVSDHRPVVAELTAVH